LTSGAMLSPRAGGGLTRKAQVRKRASTARAGFFFMIQSPLLHKCAGAVCGATIAEGGAFTRIN
jgi:hypothetical protein